MKLSLAGWWQVSPLTDLSIPQDDILFPALISSVLPTGLTEEQISAQEWHLMHDIELDEELAAPEVDLVMQGVSHYAEVRVNGVAVFDCMGDFQTMRKDIRPYLQKGRNRFEVLFLEQDEDWLLEEDGLPEEKSVQGEFVGSSLRPVAIQVEPYLHFMRNIRLHNVEVEQVWHHCGGCEVLVRLGYQVHQFGLASARVQFNGISLQLPIDMRNQALTALFQVEAPRMTKEEELGEKLIITIEEHQYEFSIPLGPTQDVMRLEL